MLTLTIAKNEPIVLTDDEMRRVALAIKQVVETKQNVYCFLRCDLQPQEKLGIDELELFFRWLGTHYRQPVSDAVDKMLTEEPAKQKQLIAKFRQSQQPVQLELPLSE